MEIVNLRNLSGDHAAAALHARGLVRVDRRTRWGNPYRVGPGAGRDEVIERYRRHLWGQIRRGDVSLEDLAALAESKGLVCHCAPRACHAEVLARAATWARDRLATGARSAQAVSGDGIDATP